MPRAKADGRPASPSKELTSIHYPLAARHQREIARYAANFGLDPSSVLRELQARLAPSIDEALGRLAADSDRYEREFADQQLELRSRLRGQTCVTAPRKAPRTPPRGADDSSDEYPLVELESVAS